MRLKMPANETLNSHDQDYQTCLHVVYSPFDKKWHINVTKSRDITFHAQKEKVLQEALSCTHQQKMGFIILHR